MAYGTAVGTRGKVLQRLIDMTNTQYRNKGIADVREVPTPVQITKKDRNGGITGRLLKAEWVDYVGVGHGRSIIFDAKETRTENFPLYNLHDHQYELLKSWWQHGSVSFLIVSFAHRNEDIYLLPFPLLRQFWEGAEKGGRKSIPYSFFVENCDKVVSKNGYVLHYLDLIQKPKAKGAVT